MKTNYETKKQAYIELANICLPTKANQIIPYFDSVNDEQKNDSFELLYGLINYINSATTAIFIMEFGKKIKPSTFEQQIVYSALLNFMKPVVLPQFSDEFTLNHTTNLFESVNATLNKIGLSLGYIDTISDSAVVFVHQTKDIKKVKEFIAVIGFKLIELQEFQNVIVEKTHSTPTSNCIDNTNEPIKHLDVADFFNEEVYFYMNKQHIIKTFGKPEKIIGNTESFYMNYYSKGVSFSIQRDIDSNQIELATTFFYNKIAEGYEKGGISKFVPKETALFNLDSNYQDILKLCGKPESKGIEEFYNITALRITYPFAHFTFDYDTKEILYFSINR